MVINGRYILALLVLVLISQAKADPHPFDLLDTSLDFFTDCLEMHNVTIDEYEKFKSADNLENVLNVKGEMKFKCNIKCQLDRGSPTLLDEMGQFNVDLLNATTEEAEYIVKCMDKASEEPCEYAVQLLICTFEAGYTIYDFNNSEEESTEAVTEEQEARDESEAKATPHPLDLLEVTDDDFSDCLRLHNVSIDEYEKFKSADSLENGLSIKAEVNFKCNIKCQLDRGSPTLLDEMGQFNVDSLNATTEKAEYIVKCMDKASEEPCEYAVQLLICSFEAGLTFYDFNNSEEESTEQATEE
ncbi:general odorant-binding protein 57a-like [Drosophila eugracilis]|uniref:general odorant-binding protein 57a-like n=1 Tax=Drosophila eugracilis TaxID=29029 RepID=UPI0007E897C4|nr:general odorant-binding protein 57a-like [Drosophila eugracilis]